MVDREARNLAAPLLSQFRECELDNYQFEEAWPEDTEDDAVGEIYLRVWHCYNDVSTHKLEGKYALDDETRAMFERAELYLKSDREYAWPRTPVVWGCCWSLLWMLTIAAPLVWIWFFWLRWLWIPVTLLAAMWLVYWWYLRRWRDQYQAAGAEEYWPFLNREDYQRTCEQLGEQ